MLRQTYNRAFLWLMLLGAGLVLSFSACERFNPPTNQDVFFIKLFGGRTADQGADVLALPGGEGFVLLGTTSSLGTDNGDILLIQTDTFGNLVQEQSLHAGLDQGRSLSPLANGSGFVLGASSLIGGQQDAWLAGFDWNDNTPNWTNQIGYPDGQESLQQILCTSDGHILVLGSTNLAIPGKNGSNGQTLPTDLSDIWLAKLDAQGQLRWQKRYGFNGFDAGVSIREFNGQYYLLAQTDYPDPEPGTARPLLIRLNADGNIVDQYVMPRVNGDLRPASLQITDTGEWLVWSTLISGTLARPDLQQISPDFGSTMAIDVSLAGTWQEARQLVPVPGNGGWMLSSVSRTAANAPGDIFINRIAPNGDSRWSHQFGYVGADETGGIIWLEDDAFLLSGTLDFDNNNSMACLIRTGQDASGFVGP